MQDLAKRIAELSPEKLAQLREELSKRNQDQNSLKIAPKLDITEFPLSFLQEGIWLSVKNGDVNMENNIPVGIRLLGPIKVEALARGLDEITKRHEILNSVFTVHEDKPVQKFSPPEALDLKIKDLADLTGEKQKETLAGQINEALSLPFNLDNGRLYRVALWRLAAQEHLLLLVFHRLVGDLRSGEILIKELASFYEAFAQEKPLKLPEKPIRYADYAYWQRQSQESMLEKSLSYWKQQLACVTGLQLPVDRPRGAAQTNRKALHPLEIPPELAQELKEISKNEGTTLFVTLLAAFQFLLYRITGQEDICVGVPVSTRNRPELEELVGAFENTIVLRANLSGTPTFLEMLNRDRNIALEAYAHQEAPFEKVMEVVSKGAIDFNSLRSVMFSLQSKPVSSAKAETLTFVLAESAVKTTLYDLALSLEEDAAGLHGTLDYNSDLFDESSIIRVLGYFTDILKEVVKKPSIRLSELGMTREYVNPKTEVEKTLVDIWKEVLNFNQIGINDNFFEIGGNSLLLVRAHDQIEKKYPGKITVAKLFSFPTIAKLAKFIEGEKEKEIKELTLKFLPLPHEYWVAQDEENEDTVFKFQLDDPVREGLSFIAADNEIDLDDISLGIFVYLLAEVAGEQQLTVQLAAPQNGELSPLNIDLAELEDFTVLFKNIHEMRRNIDSTQTYSIENFDASRVNKPAYSIMPVFSSENVAGDNLSGVFELVMKTDTKGDQASFSCEYDAAKLKKEKVEELVLNYKKLFRIIMERLS